MMEVVSESNLTLLSYHCHSLVPSGVSCVGVLLESHVSFHTWPEHGVITLDLFTCGSNPLVPVVPIIERLFGVPRNGDGKPPHAVWSHKLRGFRPPVANPLGTWDLGYDILGRILDYKKEVRFGFECMSPLEKLLSLFPPLLLPQLASVQTVFQRIDIYDVIYSRYHELENYLKSLTNNGSYENRNKDLYTPERIVLLDGVLQSRSSGEATYHEALVHPAMFAHPNPKRVAIIGGGEGATLREVLKHNTVRDAVMIEIDEVMVKVSRQYIPSWNDCSDLVGSSGWCGDDPRAQIYYEDALKWFMDRFPGKGEATEEPFDVIIMDAL
jgi:spermidine synthase